MGDHFVLLVDRLLTESTLEAAIESRNTLLPAITTANKDVVADYSSHRMDLDIGALPRKMVECRICHDEDEDSNMDIPCSCCGSLKYAHSRCVQRWCNEKGNTICEICQQPFKPGYTAPPPLFHYGGIPMNFRGNWEISRRDLHDSRFLAMVSTDRNLFEPDFDEYIVAPTSRSLILCRIVAIIFLVLLVLRHTLPMIISGEGEFSITLFTLLMLRTIAILLPIFVMFRAFTAIQRRRLQQRWPEFTSLLSGGDKPNWLKPDLRNFSPVTSDEENDLPRRPPQPHFIRVQ